MSRSDFLKLGEVYNDQLNTIKRKIVIEQKQTGKVKPGEIGEAPLVKGGPDSTEGYVKGIIDKKNKKTEDSNLYNVNELSQDETSKEVVRKTKKLTTESKKIVDRSINNFMRKKSLFDRLYENVMTPGAPAPDMGGEMDQDQELDALGIEDEGLEDDLGGEEITVSLNRELAQQLCDILQAAIGGGDLGEGDEFGDEFGGEGEGEDDSFGDDFGDEDEEEMGHAVASPKQPDMGKNNKVGNLKVKSGGASSAYTNKVGNDGDHGHAIVNGKQPDMGKNNKVGKLKVGTSLFEQ